MEASWRGLEAWAHLLRSPDPQLRCSIIRLIFPGHLVWEAMGLSLVLLLIFVCFENSLWPRTHRDPSCLESGGIKGVCHQAWQFAQACHSLDSCLWKESKQPSEQGVVSESSIALVPCCVSQLELQDICVIASRSLDSDSGLLVKGAEPRACAC